MEDKMKRYVYSFLILGIFTVLAGCADTVDTYTVTFESDTQIIATYEVIEGDDAPLPNDPVKAGYTFSGWQGSHTSISTDTTLTAQFEPITEEEPDEPEEEEVVIPFEERPILVLTYLEGMDSVLETFLDHPFEVVDSIIDVDLTEYQRMLVLYEDSLRRIIPPRLLGRPNLDAVHFVTFTNDEAIDVTMIYMDEKADFERFLTTVDSSILEIRESTYVYDYYPITGTAILDASSRFDPTALKNVLGEETSIVQGALTDDTLLNETIYAFIGNLVPSFLSRFDDVLKPLDQAVTIIELDRGQQLIIGRATGEWAEDYYADFVRQVEAGIDGPAQLTLRPPEGLETPTPRPVSADVCYIEDVRGPYSRKNEATVSNFVPETRIDSIGDVNALGVMIEFEGMPMTQTENEFRRFLNDVHTISEDYYHEVSYGQMHLTWSLHPELVTVPFFITPDLQPWNPDYERLINEHILFVLEAVEAQTDLTDIDMINFYWPAGLPDYVYGGLSAMTDDPLPTTRGEIYNYSVKKVENKYLDEPRTLARSVYHGIGHNLGFRDLYMQQAAFTQEYDSITAKYGHWDIMTAADTEVNAWHRWMMNWMTDEQVHCQPEVANESVEIFLEPLNQTGGSTQQIVIPLSRSQALSIELRDPGKYCTEVPMDVGFNTPQGGCNQNVLVTHIDSSIGNGNGPKTILRTARSTAVDYSDALMLVGEFVTYENITITHRERYAAGSVIEIRFD